MNSADFDTQFNRLVESFHLPTDAKRETLAMDWYQAVQGYDLDVLERSITTLIRSAQDRFWPPLGTLLNLCRGRAAGAPSGKCQTCHGSTWIESAPFLSNGMIYENTVIRCPDCGVPAPQYAAPSHRGNLTASEYREWSQRDKQPQNMPDGLQAHPFPPEDFSDMRAAMDRLHLKLFGFARPKKSDQGKDEVA